MAGAGYKLFNTGDVLTAAQVNTYLNEQTVMVFADSAARTTALSGVLAEGMMSYLQDTDSVEVYDGTSWTAIGGGGLSSPLTTKGDVWGYSTTDARIPVGANDTVLTADSAETLGVKWAAPAGGGGMTLINTGGTTLSGATTTISSIPGTYQELILIIQNFRPAADTGLVLYFNSDTNARYKYVTGDTGSFTFANSSILISNDVDADAATQGLSYTSIPNYANTATWKTLFSYSFTNLYNLTTSGNCTVSFGAYNQTGAITSLTLKPQSGNFTSGTAYLYGVK
jgi:hypothetical protein